MDGLKIVLAVLVVGLVLATGGCATPQERAAKAMERHGPVRETNVEAMRFDKHLGFTEECRLKGAEVDGSDTILFVMWKKDCRYLGTRHVRS